MKDIFKIIIVVASIGATATCALPLMSVYSGGMESCTLFVNGYNLMSFSAWGCVPMLATLLIPFILFGKQSGKVQEAELLFLVIANAVCYVHSFNAAREWLRSVGDSMINYHYGAVIYPLGFIGVLLLVKCFELFFKDEPCKEVKCA